ncbi:hypothetical protein BOTBODRAFT_175339 [Botryobasidium botryosum FD-172 SS1]|uniref:Uncharacterized protein n=1 Tax=Botryobasidium botryosum (strain FD-172 SS1) TaxID=930990 RepID=A0A067MCX2_BOTB1|nr:hypothetical protein BOTBODRAFT_175339 [Botryobasidium botryosum FD-172 SS1]
MSSLQSSSSASLVPKHREAHLKSPLNMLRHAFLNLKVRPPDNSNPSAQPKSPVADSTSAESSPPLQPTPDEAHRSANTPSRASSRAPSRDRSVFTEAVTSYMVLDGKDVLAITATGDGKLVLVTTATRSETLRASSAQRPGPPDHSDPCLDPPGTWTS